MFFLMESKRQRLLTHEIKTKAPHSQRRGKWRVEEKRRGPTAAAKGPESSEKYDGELMREEEDVGRRRRKIKRRENPSEMLNFVNTDLQRRTSKLMRRDTGEANTLRIQHFLFSVTFIFNFFKCSLKRKRAQSTRMCVSQL